MCACLRRHTRPSATRPQPWLGFMACMKKPLPHVPHEPQALCKHSSYAQFFTFFSPRPPHMVIVFHEKKSQWHFLQKKKKKEIIFFGKFSFWKENNAFETFILKTFIAHVSLKIFGFISNAMKTVFETSRFTVKQTFQPSDSSGSRRSLETLGTIHPRDTKLLVCHFSGKIGTFFGHLFAPKPWGLLYACKHLLHEIQPLSTVGSWTPMLLCPWEIIAGESLSSAYNLKNQMLDWFYRRVTSVVRFQSPCTQQDMR